MAYDSNSLVPICGCRKGRKHVHFLRCSFKFSTTHLHFLLSIDVVPSLQGPAIHVLVQEGALRVGQHFVAGMVRGRVRALRRFEDDDDDNGDLSDLELEEEEVEEVCQHTLHSSSMRLLLLARLHLRRGQQLMQGAFREVTTLWITMRMMMIPLSHNRLTLRRLSSTPVNSKSFAPHASALEGFNGQLPCRLRRYMADDWQF